MASRIRRTVRASRRCESLSHHAGLRHRKDQRNAVSVPEFRQGRSLEKGGILSRNQKGLPFAASGMSRLDRNDGVTDSGVETEKRSFRTLVVTSNGAAVQCRQSRCAPCGVDSLPPLYRQQVRQGQVLADNPGLEIRRNPDNMNVLGQQWTLVDNSHLELANRRYRPLSHLSRL